MLPSDQAELWPAGIILILYILHDRYRFTLPAHIQQHVLDAFLLAGAWLAFFTRAWIGTIRIHPANERVSEHIFS